MFKKNPAVMNTCKRNHIVPAKMMRMQRTKNEVTQPMLPFETDPPTQRVPLQHV